MKKLDFGLMRLPVLDNKTDQIDTETLEVMVDVFLDQGFIYFDTTRLYHKEQLELAIGKALADRHPRGSYVLVDKMSTALLDPGKKSPEELRQDLESYFNRQLEETGAGYFDYYLLHSLDREKFDVAKTYKAYEFIQGKKTRA